MVLHHVNGGYKACRTGKSYTGGYAKQLAVRQIRAIAISIKRRSGRKIPYRKAKPLHTHYTTFKTQHRKRTVAKPKKARKMKWTGHGALNKQKRTRSGRFY